MPYGVPSNSGTLSRNSACTAKQHHLLHELPRARTVACKVDAQGGVAGVAAPRHVAGVPRPGLAGDGGGGEEEGEGEEGMHGGWVVSDGTRIVKPNAWALQRSKTDVEVLDKHTHGFGFHAHRISVTVL